MDVFQSSVAEQQRPEQPRPSTSRRLHFVAISVGVGCALLIASGGGPGAVWGKTNSLSSQINSPESSTLVSERDLDRLKPQEQAEILLEHAVSRSEGATDRIEARVEGWRGQLKWDSQLGDLTTLALSSSDENVRASAIEVQLAAYGLPKTESSVDALVRQADSRNHAQKIWALWTLGLLGNRGVETDRVVQVLTAHLKADDYKNVEYKNKEKDKDKGEDSRRWAVEALALVGTTSTIEPLLQAMHNDPSPSVRQLAACTMAESSMLSHDQRLVAVPQLINYSDDPALDPQTHALVFQTLADITRQRLPNDSAAWRNWYQTRGREN
jgi:HEAT repeat protein